MMSRRMTSTCTSSTKTKLKREKDLTQPKVKRVPTHQQDRAPRTRTIQPLNPKTRLILATIQLHSAITSNLTISNKLLLLVRKMKTQRKRMASRSYSSHPECILGKAPPSS